LSQDRVHPVERHSRSFPTGTDRQFSGSRRRTRSGYALLRSVSVVDLHLWYGGGLVFGCKDRGPVMALRRPTRFADILRTQIKGRSQAAALSARNSLIFRANLARPKRFELLTPRFVVVQWSVRRLRPAVRLKHRCQACGQFSGCRHPAFEACELQLVVSAHRAVVVPASCPAPLHVQDRRERAL
jgi:hypothetical protein